MRVLAPPAASSQRLAMAPGMNLALSVVATAAALTGAAAQGTNFYALSAVDIGGNSVDFSQYMGTVSLVVNVATY